MSKNEQLLEYIESLGFKISEYDEGRRVEFETHTMYGVHMVFNTSLEELMEYCLSIYRNFDVDEEIDIHRQNEDYAKHFSIRDSLEDFENFEATLKKIEDKAIKIYYAKHFSIRNSLETL